MTSPIEALRELVNAICSNVGLRRTGAYEPWLSQAVEVLAQPDEQIELHAEIDGDGNVTIKDQHGRTLKGVQAVRVTRAADDVASMFVRVLEYRDGRVFVNGADR